MNHNQNSLEPSTDPSTYPDSSDSFPSSPEPQEFKEKPSDSSNSFFIPKLAMAFFTLPLNFLQVNQIVHKSESSSLSKLISGTYSSKGLYGFFRGYDSLIISRAITQISLPITNSLFLQMIYQSREQNNHLKAFLWMVGGSFFSGCVSGICTSPIESILVRSQTMGDSHVKYKDYSGVLSAFRAIQAEKQLSGLYRGTLAFMGFKAAGSAFWTFWSFVCFIPDKSETGKFYATIGILASLGVVYPLEYLRVKMQSELAGDKSLSYKRVFSETVKKFGFTRLYTGFGVYCVHRVIYCYFMYSLFSAR